MTVRLVGKQVKDLKMVKKQFNLRTLTTSFSINPLGVLPVSLDQQLCLLIGSIGPLCDTLTSSSM